ncbi:hypothetical protein GCM10007036_14380 [Alsobacter metallidurans]|uniref:Uncharacterized protein n=1 Tax=Alsobacter metallidurans TaxID=340221 RepID=A0A917I5Z0_9HYPH|nr:hypothetical protein [Alsobacter metallidurans]GGH14820.1 hypothetical protein GCM10007036_14380 [Alsobacter metallidurans]
MADVHDVENALVSIIAAAIYPNGTGQPSAIGAGCRIFPGWPKPQGLDADLLAGIVNISVFTTPNASTNTSRFPKTWHPLQAPAKTLNAVAAGQGITFSGAVTVPENVSVGVNGKPSSYAVQAGDTLTTIATAVAAMVSPDLAGVSSSGATVTFPSTARIEVRIGGAANAVRELRRQQQRFQVTVWAASPTARAAAAKLVDAKLAALNFITMPDGVAARLTYFGTASIDNAEKEGLYRRDIFYTVEYATTETELEYEITVVQLNVGDGTVISLKHVPAVDAPPAYGDVTTASVAGVLTIDLALGSVFRFTLSENVTSVAFLNRPPAGSIRRIELVATQDGVGGRTIAASAWPAGSTSASGAAPQLSVAAGASDIIVVELGATATSATLVGQNYRAFN